MAVFSNGSQWEIWSYNWCGRCAKDSEELVDAGEGCPHILTAMLRGEARGLDPRVDLGWYECADFEDRDEGSRLSTTSC